VVIDGTEALTAADEEILAAVQDKPYVLIVNKADLQHSGVTKMLQEKYPQATVLELSAKTGAGLDAFQSWLHKFVYGAQEHGGEALYVANARQENLLRQAAASLTSAREGAEQRLPYDCLSIDVNAALTALGEITGQAVSDEIINQIFARFCVGK
jgi:tRNA modification GTPase